MKDEWLHGRNPVLEALRASRRPVREICIVSGSRSAKIDEIRAIAREHRVRIEDVDGRWMAQRRPERDDQEVIARVAPYPYASLGELLAPSPEPPLVVALDQVQDPHNLGAVVRSALAFGARGLVIHKDRSAAVTPAAVKASAGMTERLPIARVTNLARALDQARDAGIWLRGLEAGSHTCIWEEDLTLPTLLVVGGEDSGLRRLTAERMDSLLGIPLEPGCPSLNASTAAAVALAEVARQRSRRT